MEGGTRLPFEDECIFLVPISSREDGYVQTGRAEGKTPVSTGHIHPSEPPDHKSTPRAGGRTNPGNRLYLRRFVKFQNRGESAAGPELANPLFHSPAPLRIGRVFAHPLRWNPIPADRAEEPDPKTPLVFSSEDPKDEGR